MALKRSRSVGSIKLELIKKSREAALAAVQVFNNPIIQFKSEIFIVLMVISWTYLMHAYYRGRKIEYRYHTLTAGKRKRFDTTAKGLHKYWELERCIGDKNSPLDKNTANNLKFLIGIRHEIEHQMTTKIDHILSARFQACCLNYNYYIKKLFGECFGIDRHLSFSLQFSTLSESNVDYLSEQSDLPKHIARYIIGFDGALSEKEYNSQMFAYRVMFVPKLANRVGQADKVIEFIKSDSELAKHVNAQYTVLKEVEKRKYLPGYVVGLMVKEGYGHFSMYHHIKLWKEMKARDSKYNFGVFVAGTWYWYDNWIDVVRKHCHDNAHLYSL